MGTESALGPDVPESDRSLAAVATRVAVLAATWVMSNLYVVWFVAAEHALYTADHVAYWSFSVSLTNHLKTAPIDAISAIAHSVATSQLNLLPATPIAVLMIVFGTSRMVYELLVLNLYAIPVLILTLMAVRRFSGLKGTDCHRSTLDLWATVAAVLLVPTLWWPISFGYLGIGGVGLCLLALMLYFTHGREPTPVLHLVAVGVVLCGLFLFRRWYAFWAVAFGVMVLADALTELWQRRGGGEAWAALRAPVIIGGSSVMAAVVLAPSLVAQVVMTDYGDRFKAYKIHETVFAELAAWVHHFGWLVLGLFVVSAGVLISSAARRRVTLLMLLQMVVTFLLFRRVQDPSPQHWYIYLAIMLVVTAAGFVELSHRARGRFSHRLSAAVILGLGVLSTVVFARPSGPTLAPFLSAPQMVPQTRSDLREVRRLLSFLDRLQANAPGYIYVLGSSPTLSDTSLGFANLSLGTSYQSPYLIAQSAHVDRRDGFPANLLEVRYVVVGEPLQCRQPAVDQRVIEVPARQILDGRGFGRAFAPGPGARAGRRTGSSGSRAWVPWGAPGRAGSATRVRLPGSRPPRSRPQAAQRAGRWPAATRTTKRHARSPKRG